MRRFVPYLILVTSTIVKFRDVKMRAFPWNARTKCAHFGGMRGFPFIEKTYYRYIITPPNDANRLSSSSVEVLRAERDII